MRGRRARRLSRPHLRRLALASLRRVPLLPTLRSRPRLPLQEQRLQMLPLRRLQQCHNSPGGTALVPSGRSKRPAQRRRRLAVSAFQMTDYHLRSPVRARTHRQAVAGLPALACRPGELAQPVDQLAGPDRLMLLSAHHSIASRRWVAQSSSPVVAAELAQVELAPAPVGSAPAVPRRRHQTDRAPPERAKHSRNPADAPPALERNHP